MRSAPRPSVIHPAAKRATPVAMMGAGPGGTSDRISASLARRSEPRDNKGLFIGVGVAFAVLAAIVAVMAITGSIGNPEPVVDQKAATPSTPVAAKKASVPTPKAAPTATADAAPADAASTETAPDAGVAK